MNVLLVALDDLPPAKVPEGTVLVVAPALNSRLRHWLSDEDEARRRAEERLAAFLDRIARSGVDAEGRVGDADPLLAIADALVMFPADAIVTQPAPRARPSSRTSSCPARTTASRSPLLALAGRSHKRRSGRSGIGAGRRCLERTRDQPLRKEAP
jgi:hypothetical protein